MIGSELLTVIDTVAREKSIDRMEVVFAIEEAIQKAARAKYGQEHDIRAKMDPDTGHVDLSVHYVVVDELLDHHTEISLDKARAKDPHLNVGDTYSESLPPIDFGRVAAQTAKQVIYQKVREAERMRQYMEFKDRVGDIVSGVVKRVEFGNVTLDLGRAEAMLRRDALIPRETFRPGDRVRAYLYDVRQELRGPQIFVSRAHPQFMVKLFEQEVPEIFDGIISIKAAARDPGSRAKIAVFAQDASLDPVGSCVGVRGSRVQAVVNELQGEKIDIILWSANPATFVVNALAPAEVAKVVVDEDKGRIEVVIPEDQLSLAIGRRGQNVRLASQLTGWTLDILTEAEEAERRSKEFKALSNIFMDALNVDEMVAHILIDEGFRKVEEIALSPLDELATLEGFDAELAHELQTRSRAFIDNRKMAQVRTYNDLGGQQSLIDFLPDYDYDIYIKLAENKVLTLDDLADLAGDELVEILGEDILSLDDANALIMRAREHWFENDAQSSIG